MLDWSDNLTAIFYKKMNYLEMGLLDDADPPEGHDEEMRRNLVVEVLKQQANVTDEPTRELVLAAMPRALDGRMPEGERAKFAEFLRRTLPRK